MGEYWKFVCMDARQSSKDLGKLGEFFFDTLPYDYFYERLAVPDSFPQDLPPLSPIKKIGPNKPSAFEELPYEILEQIFKSLGDFEDMLTLALSSYRFLELGRICILKHFKTSLGSWAGKRLICAGDYANSHPKGFLTKKELKELKRENLYNFGDDGGFEIVSHIRDMDLYDFESARQYATYTEKRKVANKLFEECKTENFLTEKPNVLRNLTTKEYITEDYVKKYTNQYEFDIGTVLLSQICWPDDRSISICTDHGEELIKGRWAGQRFDITTADKVDESWINVSEEVVKFVYQIYDQGY